MTKQRILARGLVAAASISMLAACSPTGTPTTPGTPSSSPTAAPTTEPTAGPTAEPTAGPTAEPTAGPTAEPTAVPTADPSATATPTAAPTTGPTAEATSDISVVEKTTVNGKAFDDTGAPLDGVTVTARSLNSSVPFEATTTTAGGTYAFNNAPAGVQIEITASRSGYTTRRRVEVLKSNKQGDPNANRYDFGNNDGFGQSFTALSDKPEVTMVTPGRNAAGVDPATSFVLKFSEPMDRNTVVDSLLIRAFTTESLSVDNQVTVTGSNVVTAVTGTRIWDKAAFNVSWNSDDTEVTLTFKEERALPTDKDSDKVPDYQVTFSRLGGASDVLKDKSGISRASNYFKLTEGDFETSYKFSIRIDDKKPTLDNVVAQTQENSGANSEGDVLRIRYSERMIHYTLDRTIAGGINAVTTQAPAAVTDSQSSETVTAETAAANYRVIVSRGSNTLLNNVTWSALGGRAIYDTTDPTHKTVLLLPGSASGTLTTVAAPTAGQTATVNFVYTDGTSESIATAGLADASRADLEAKLDALLETEVVGGVTPVNFTVNNLTEAVANANFDAGDTFSITLGTPAFRNNAVAGTHGKQVASVNISQSGAFAAGVLNAPSTGYVMYPNTAAGARLNVYQPGDNVNVRVETTVVDPAGNTVDSSGDDVSANAS